jgi:L-ascorbate metabolism protein UlaG (beta-lactamase superfamily)
MVNYFKKHTFIYSITTALFIIAACSSSEMKYSKNDQLSTIKKDYAGNPKRGNMFVNYEDVELPGFGALIRWKGSKNPQEAEKKKDLWRPEVVKDNSIFTDKRDKIVWLGHATFLITLNGKNILTDPVFNDIPFIKRLVGIPCDRNEIKNIDYVLLSHGHFDHCDKESFRTLAAQNPQMKVFAPLSMTSVLHGFNKQLNVQEAGWYQQFKVDDEQIEIFYMPAFHWYKRGLRDNNTILWGSFVIRCKGKTIFFMGDSGYNTHFTEIASFFPEIDYCIMGVGAYKPNFMMKTSHASPEEAVKAFHDLKGKTFIPMHYGTFDLADEPIGEPLRKLNEMAGKKEINGKLVAPKIGEIVLIE